MDEWELLVEQWKATPFEALVVDDVHRDVTRFVQTVFLLEKGIDSKKVFIKRIPKKVILFERSPIFDYILSI